MTDRLDDEKLARDSSAMTELSNLIDAASRANNGRSMHAAAALATRRGSPISKSLISKNAQKVQSITPAMVRGIAAGYDVPEEDVLRAACADLGLPIPDYRPTPESAVRRDPDLGAQPKAMLLAALSAARQSLHGAEPWPGKWGGAVSGDTIGGGSDDG